MDADDAERNLETEALDLIARYPIPVSRQRLGEELGISPYRAAQLLAGLWGAGKIRRPEGRKYGWEACDG